MALWFSTMARTRQYPMEKKPHPTTVHLDLLKSGIALAAVLVPAIGLWLTYRNGQPTRNQTTQDLFSLRVFSDFRNKTPVEGAEISLGLPEIPPSYTVSFAIDKNLIGTDARIIVRKDGLATYNQQIVLRPRKSFYDIYLTKPPTSKSAAPDAAPTLISPPDKPSRKPLSPNNKEQFEEVKAAADQLTASWRENKEFLKSKGLNLRPEIEQALTDLQVRSKAAGLAVQSGNMEEAHRNLVGAQEDIAFLRHQQP
jgi:hypothetical protein